MQVPRVIENSTLNNVLLDCDYTLKPGEGDGLVVKWYLNDIPKPVYQWIPGKRPQDLGRLKGKVNLDFKISEDPLKMHRAILLFRPTTELSGKYKCKVSTYLDEDEDHRDMIIFAPAKDFKIWHFKPEPNKVNVTCMASGVFPLPSLELFSGVKAPLQRAEIPDGARHIRELRYSYDMHLYNIYNDEDLEPDTVFECRLGIPGTEYQIRENSVYYPGLDVMPSISAEAVNSTSLRAIAVPVSTMLLFTLFLH
ncbi:uncharacterized protein LOC136025323 isoform X2 [Artemia franciscana]